MRNLLAALVVSLQCACATAERPAFAPGEVSDVHFEPIALPDGGHGSLTRPTVDVKVLTEGLMPKGHAGGIVIVRCAVTAEGQILNCAAVRDAAGLASAVIERLESMHATPATLDGKPFPIDYVFNFRFQP